METKLYNMNGEAIGTAQLPNELFDVAVRPAVVKRAVLAQQANSRVARAHTKTRSEVRGGGRKPWRQKGTGRARHGSIRSPIWVGGGITFGPRSDRNFSIGINKKERRLALLMALSAKAKEDRVIVLDELTMPEVKTKSFAVMLKKFPMLGKRTLIVQAKPDANITKSARNLRSVATIGAASINVVDVLRSDALLLPKGAIETMKNTYGVS